jgi:hypothetical protein
VIETFRLVEVTMAIPGELLSSIAHFRFANRRALSERPSTRARTSYLDNERQERKRLSPTVPGG